MELPTIPAEPHALPIDIDTMRHLGATPESAAQGHTTVRMSFPHQVIMTADGGPIHYPKGVHEVPEHLADHWFLRANGVLPIAASEAEPAEK